MQEYSRRDIARWTRASESHLTHWSKIGLLRADVRETAGRGHHRRFSFRVLVEAEIAAHLNAVGVPVANIQTVLEGSMTNSVTVQGVRRFGRSDATG